MQISYTEGYKYQLVFGFSLKTGIKCGEYIETKYITLNKNGILVISPGYAWDGPSGPTYDSKSYMVAALVHDALYQLMRMGLLSVIWRAYIDNMFYHMCLDDGMWRWRAYLAYRAVRRFGAPSASAGKLKPILEAGRAIYNHKWFKEEK